MIPDYPPGFEPGQLPRYEVPSRKKGGTTPLHVPTKKSVRGRNIRAAHPLMAHFLMHLETDPNVRKISPYPIEIEYQRSGSSGDTTTVSHIPDLGILHRDGSIVFCDIVPEAILAEQRHRTRRADDLRQAYTDQLGAAYSIITELDVYVEPRMTNVSTLWRHRDCDDPEALRKVIGVLDRMTFPTTIAEIVEQADLPHLIWETDSDGATERQVLSDVNRAFSCILQMACEGRLDVDLANPISPASRIARMF